MLGLLDDFYRDYFALRTRITAFRVKGDFETIKTVSVVDELMRRAEAVHSGAAVHGRFNFVIGHTVENYMERAERYTAALERGEYPLRGMFAEPGTAMSDHCFVEKDGIMHLFYNRDYIGAEWDTMPTDTIGHAITEDLVHWKIERPVITTLPGTQEEHQLWSPGIAQKGDTYYMYYTGVNINVAQAICVATSKDLYTWERRSDLNPVVKPGPWGEWHADRWSDCRDPMTFVDDDGTAYMYYCTMMHGPDGNMTPAVGIAKSIDMLTWEDLGAYHFDICDFALESPFLIKHGGQYYLFYTNCNHGTAYAVSDNPVSGWHGGGMLIEKENPANTANVPSCAEVFPFKGRWYISSAERQPGCEQYMELYEFFWNEDGTVRVGKRLEEIC